MTDDSKPLTSIPHPNLVAEQAAYDAFMRHALAGHPSIVLVASTLPLDKHRDTYRIIWRDVANAVLKTADPSEVDQKTHGVLAQGVSVLSIEITMPERPQSMVDRVAQRVYNNVGKQLSVEEEARRILEAMVEPTVEIIGAGVASLASDNSRSNHTKIADAWRDMIKAAIGSRTWPTA